MNAVDLKYLGDLGFLLAHVKEGEGDHGRALKTLPVLKFPCHLEHHGAELAVKVMKWRLLLLAVVIQLCGIGPCMWNKA